MIFLILYPEINFGCLSIPDSLTPCHHGSSMVELKKLYVSIKFCFELATHTSDNHEKLKQAFGHDTMDKSNTFDCFAWITCKQMSVENNQCFGRLRRCVIWFRSAAQWNRGTQHEAIAVKFIFPLFTQKQSLLCARSSKKLSETIWTSFPRFQMTKAGFLPITLNWRSSHPRQSLHSL